MLKTFITGIWRRKKKLPSNTAYLYPSKCNSSPTCRVWYVSPRQQLKVSQWRFHSMRASNGCSILIWINCDCKIIHTYKKKNHKVSPIRFLNACSQPTISAPDHRPCVWPRRRSSSGALSLYCIVPDHSLSSSIPLAYNYYQCINFSSHLFRRVSKQLNAERNKVSAHRARGQGALEYFRQMLKSSLCCYCT